MSGMGKRSQTGRQGLQAFLNHKHLPQVEGSWFRRVPALEDRIRENGNIMAKGGVLQGQGQSLGKQSLET